MSTGNQRVKAIHLAHSQVLLLSLSFCENVQSILLISVRIISNSPLHPTEGYYFCWYTHLIWLFNWNIQMTALTLGKNCSCNCKRLYFGFTACFWNQFQGCNQQIFSCVEQHFKKKTCELAHLQASLLHSLHSRYSLLYIVYKTVI